MRVFETRDRGRPSAVRRLAWMVGPLAASGALVVLGAVWLGLFASGGGLLIALGVAFWVGWGAAAFFDPRRSWRHAIIVVGYLLAVLVTFIAVAQSQQPPPGASHGGPNVPPP